MKDPVKDARHEECMKRAIAQITGLPRRLAKHIDTPEGIDWKSVMPDSNSLYRDDVKISREAWKAHREIYEVYGIRVKLIVLTWDNQLKWAWADEVEWDFSGMRMPYKSLLDPVWKEL